jgi:hypothetical protein
MTQISAMKIAMLALAGFANCKHTPTRKNNNTHMIQGKEKSFSYKC